MGGYQLSLQGGSDAKSHKKTGSPRGGFGLFQSKRVASQHNLEGLMMHPASPPRHSTACCDGLSMQRESLSLQRSKAYVPVHEPGHSFRSDDSDNLALWEEMEPTVTRDERDVDRDGWVKLTTQSPRWLDAMAKLAPWRSSPVHPKSCDTPRVSLDRKPSTRSLHESTKAWYNKKGRSVWSPKLANSAKWDHDSEDGSKHGSFSRMMDEDTRFTASAVAWDISPRPDTEKPTRPVTGLAWEIPVEIGDADTIDTVTDNASECDDSSRSEAFFDGQSEYASCRTFVDDELVPFPESNESTKDVGFVNVIDFVAPLLTKLQSIEKKEDSRRVSFKWEAKVPVEEVAPTTETPQPPPIAGGSSYETLRQEYILKSKSAPLDGLYVFLPQSGSPLPWVKSLKKSKSYNGDGNALRRVNSSPDHRLFRTAPGPSPLGINNIKKDEENESGSPRSILRGPDDGSSVPSSSNPSLRSDRPQSMSSCSASFDLNEGDYEMTYNLNSSAACIIVESRRVSLSFRDFGPAQPDIMGEASPEFSNVELLGCDRGQLDTTSPELWTATFSARYKPESPLAELPEITSPPPVRQLAYLMSCEDEQDQQQQQQQARPIVMQKSRSRNGDQFTARLGVMFSPLRLISSHESSNHGCFVTTTLSPPHDDGDQPSTLVKILSPAVQLHSSSMKTTRKSKGSWTNHVEMAKSRSSKRRHSSDDPQTMMVTLSKAMKKILSKCTVKRSTSKGKSKMDSPALAALAPPEFQFT